MVDLARSIFSLLESAGYWGIFVGLMVEVIPSEIVLTYGGFLVSRGSISFTGAVICGTTGGTLAHLLLYALGKYGGRPFVIKYGKYIFIHEKHLQLAETWFSRYGGGVIFAARFIPVVRHAISIPAGIANMSSWKFTALTALAVLPWTLFFVWIGYELGANWREFEQYAGDALRIVTVVAIMVVAIYLYVKSRRKNDGPNDT